MGGYPGSQGHCLYRERLIRYGGEQSRKHYTQNFAEDLSWHRPDHWF